MRSFTCWIGATGLACALIGGAAQAGVLEDGAAASSSGSSEIVPAIGSTDATASSVDPASSLTILDPQVRPTGATSVIENTDNLISDDCECCCSAPPAWIVSSGAVFLHRSRPEPNAIATPPTGTPGTLISSSNFGFNWNSGPIVSIGRRTKSGWILEGRYFSDRDATANFGLTNINTFRMAGIGITILGGGSLGGGYYTQLDNTEFNALKPLNDRVSLIGGFRAVQLHDRLNMNIATPGIFATWNEMNRLYGAQTGLNFNLFQPGRALQFNGALKAGIYGNTANNQFTSNVVSNATSTGTSAAFVGELNFTGSYQLTKRWSVRGGYMVLWVDGLALADRTAATTHQVAGGSSSPISLNSGLWYNGALVSMDYVW